MMGNMLMELQWKNASKAEIEALPPPLPKEQRPTWGEGNGVDPQVVQRILNSPEAQESKKLASEIANIKTSIKKKEALCTFEYKLGILVKMLTGLSEKPVSESIVKASVSVIRELNLMQGHYAPLRAMNVNVNLDEAKAKQIDETLIQCMGNY